MYFCFLLMIQYRVLFHFCMDICGRRENLFLCSLGEWTYSYPAALPMSPASTFIGGTPCPAAACPLPADRHKKNTPARPSSSTARPRVPPAVDPARLHMLRTVPLRTVPLRTVSACCRAVAGNYFAKYLFSEPQIHVLSFFCSRFWILCINSLSASVTASAVISI